MGAFEMYAKASLLKNGYIIHIINNNSLQEKQTKTPIHINEFQECQSINIKIDRTIGTFHLLKETYFQKLPLEGSHINALSDIYKDRNNIHFYGSGICKNGEKLSHFYAILDLYEKIEANVNYYQKI